MLPPCPCFGFSFLSSFLLASLPPVALAARAAPGDWKNKARVTLLLPESCSQSAGKSKACGMRRGRHALEGVGKLATVLQGLLHLIHRVRRQRLQGDEMWSVRDNEKR